ncbi:hypothetical protein ACA910_019528 [Epithemia clementina (nom. ined.)]
MATPTTATTSFVAGGGGGGRESSGGSGSSTTNSDDGGTAEPTTLSSLQPTPTSTPAAPSSTTTTTAATTTSHPSTTASATLSHLFHYNNHHHHHHHHHHHKSNNSNSNNTTMTHSALLYQSYVDRAWLFWDELTASVDLVFTTGTNTKVIWLLALGPIALVGSITNFMNDALCFACAGLALIPCAERLSFITEQVAEHTNGTIGALLNATFGNAPELLISVAALRAGYYRVVQLAMLGSMLTNMILVFGVACLIGGLRWQVQELRITSGNVHVVMLLVATAGCLFPAALKLAGQYNLHHKDHDLVTPVELAFCRVNAVVMLFLYLCFLLFQLKTHKEEYDEDDTGFHSKRARRNLVCISLYERIKRRILPAQWQDYLETSNSARQGGGNTNTGTTATNRRAITAEDEEDVPLMMTSSSSHNPPQQHRRNVSLEEDLDFSERSYKSDDGGGIVNVTIQKRRRRQQQQDAVAAANARVQASRPHPGRSAITSRDYEKSKHSDSALLVDPETGASKDNGLYDGIDHLIANLDSDGADESLDHHPHDGDDRDENNYENDQFEDDESHGHLHPVHVKSGGPLISMSVGIVWLFIITVCISVMSDLLVDTIDGFAQRLHLSEVFTSMVIIPFFSNVAEQVSAFLFAYRDEMDLCVGVTVGSAIQIATFVLPGSVIIGYFMDRSMTLYFHGYETVCLFFAVVVVGAILQGGTTNWMTGAMLVGIYIMFASGIWFHELESLTTNDDEYTYNNNNSMQASSGGGNTSGTPHHE